ncbi:triose-phosphate isomerase [Puia dinghuensis]|uniref:Triosephosphate isomerase n=1 Tax=Puia dinghuensis TaxID=1792502 RepID=A0A8J2U8D1_9BACT|nr:triose-phosphate isomerase [Puia dinghuensis]GGA86011.1 triosephosphate isomerase [Puia dinghuensis]
MRQQIAAANWKMNLTYQQGEQLLDAILKENIALADHQAAVFAVPFPYLMMASQKLSGRTNYYVSAQNCSDVKAGAYTGEVSAEMLKSINIGYCVLGHSERREYFSERNQSLAQKVQLCLDNGITPIFCCGESLSIREVGAQEGFVETQLMESLFHFSEADIRKIVIAYEPIWAIGTGKTATAAQAQEMHAHIRHLFAKKYNKATADHIPILYGGSVKAANAMELFHSPDVDGGLVGGASLVATEFISIIRALK